MLDLNARCNSTEDRIAKVVEAAKATMKIDSAVLMWSNNAFALVAVDRRLTLSAECRFMLRACLHGRNLIYQGGCVHI